LSDSVDVSFQNFNLSVIDFNENIYSITDTQCMFLMFSKVNLTFDVYTIYS